MPKFQVKAHEMWRRTPPKNAQHSPGTPVHPASTPPWELTVPPILSSRPETPRPRSSVRGNCLQEKRKGEVRHEQQRLPTESPFYLHKRRIGTASSTGPGPGHLSGWNQLRGWWGPQHKPATVAGQRQKQSHLLFCLGHPKWYPKYYTSNCTLLEVGREPCLPQRLQDRSHPPHMLRPHVTVDDYII